MPDIDPQDPAQDPAQPTGTGRFFSQEEHEAALAAARQQEKDKLYGRREKDNENLKTLQAEVAELRKSAKAREKEEADRLAEIEAARKKAAEAELSAKELIEKRQAEWQAQRDADLAREAAERELLKKEMEFMQLQSYVQRRIAEESDNIAPELLQFVDGKTPEEVEASIERVKASTASIVENMRNAGVRQRAAMPGVAPSAGTNGITHLDQPGDRQLTADEIKGMDMNQFRALRDKLGMDRLHSGGAGVLG
jgi:hypothetical protein